MAFAALRTVVSTITLICIIILFMMVGRLNKTVNEIANNQNGTNTESTLNIKVTGDNNTTVSTNVTSDVDPEDPALYNDQFGPKPASEQTNTGYQINTSYKTYDFSESHPYLKDYDLVEYGCPNCGYQLYCRDSAGTAASAELRCTRCDWHSKEVYIESCTKSSVARERLLTLYAAGELTKDIKFEN